MTWILCFVVTLGLRLWVLFGAGLLVGCGCVWIILFSVVLLGLVLGLWIGDSWVVGLGRYCWLV